jgi:NAD(P)-dependent dehydrogenase (short-subunit alcohol dehydrogenase family)
MTYQPFDPEVLRGKSAIITGGYRGIGLQVSKTLMDYGMQVVIMCRNGKHALPVVEALNAAAASAGSDARAHLAVGDVNDAADRQSALATAEQLGQYAVLVNNAGTGAFGAMETLDDQQIYDTLTTNLISPMQLIAAASRVFRVNGFGRIINIGSDVVSYNLANAAPYVCSKIALQKITELAAYEVTRDLSDFNGANVAGGPVNIELDIRVNFLRLGATATEMIQSSVDQFASEADYMEMINPKDTLGRVFRLEEIKPVIRYMLEVANNGQVIPLSGAAN